MFEKLMNHFRNAEKNAAYYRKLGLKLGGGASRFSMAGILEVNRG